MSKTPNQVHVYNFGYFYMPSYHEGYEETYDEDLDHGKLSVWEGDLENHYGNDDPYDQKWPVI